MKGDNCILMVVITLCSVLCSISAIVQHLKLSFLLGKVWYVLCTKTDNRRSKWFLNCLQMWTRDKSVVDIWLLFYMILYVTNCCF